MNEEILKQLLEIYKLGCDDAYRRGMHDGWALCAEENAKYLKKEKTNEV